MPVYTLRCECGGTDEFYFDVHDPDKATECPDCGATISVANNRDWQSDMPSIQGDTCSHCANLSEYYDPGLGVYVKGRGHRRALMKERGLSEWEPDKFMNETGYIRKNSRPEDKDAQRAIKKEYKSAHKQRQEQAVKTSFDEALKKKPLPRLG